MYVSSNPVPAGSDVSEVADPADVRRYVAKLRNYGYDVEDIVHRVRTRFRCPMTQKLVRHHLAEIRKWDAEDLRVEREEAVAEALAGLRLLRQKTYEAFDRSTEALTVQAVVNGEVRSLVKERDGDAKFLTVLLGIVDREIKLRDLEPVERTEVRAAVTSFDWNSFLSMPRQVESNDPVQDAFAALEAMPRPVNNATIPGENVTVEGGDGG